MNLDQFLNFSIFSNSHPSFSFCFLQSPISHFALRKGMEEEGEAQWAKIYHFEKMARENGISNLLLKQVKQNTMSTTTKLGPSLYMGIYSLFCSVSQNLIFTKNENLGQIFGNMHKFPSKDCGESLIMCHRVWQTKICWK